jgi:hypothetical protein
VHVAQTPPIGDAQSEAAGVDSAAEGDITWGCSDAAYR